MPVTLTDVLFYFQVEIFLLWLSLFFLIFWAGVWGVHVIGICYGKWKLNRKVNAGPRETPLPGVSIIKPLVGVDSNLFGNLESFFTLQYPIYEILFCFHNDYDPSLMAVEALIKKYPNVDAKVFKGGEEIGLNPKINNISPAYKASKYDLILISDSGIRMKEDTLLDMVEAMTDKVGIVTQMPYTCDRSGFAGTLEKVFFGTAHARIYLSADCLGIVCTTGMSSMMRKPVLEDLGGLSSFCHYIAEDYFFAKGITSKGWKCAISSQPAWQNSGVCEVSKFHARVCRWTKLRVAMLPHTMLLEPMQECMLLGLLGCVAVNFIFGWNSLVFFLIHVLIWMLLDYVMLSIVQNGPLPFGKFEFVISWLYRELSAFPVFLGALIYPRIDWRNNGSFKIKWGGKAVKLDKPATPPPSLIKTAKS